MENINLSMRQYDSRFPSTNSEASDTTLFDLQKGGWIFEDEDIEALFNGDKVNLHHGYRTLLLIKK